MWKSVNSSLCFRTINIKMYIIITILSSSHYFSAFLYFEERIRLKHTHPWFQLLISNNYTVTKILITTDKKGLLNFKQNLHGGCQRKLDAFHFFSSSNKLSRKTIQHCIRHLDRSQHASNEEMFRKYVTFYTVTIKKNYHIVITRNQSSEFRSC